MTELFRRLVNFFRRLVKEKPLSIIAGVVILLLILVAIFADVLAPFPHDEVNIVDRMQAPSGRYLLGTEQLGRDLLSRLIFGAQISLTVGLAATAVNVVVAVLIGGPSGFFGGRLDLAAQRFVDAWMAFPGLLLTIMSLVGRGVPQIIVVLGVTGGIGGSRVIRGAVIGVKENVYFQAAEAIGSTKWRILIRHVLPNIAAPVIIIFTINVGGVIISEAARPELHQRRRGFQEAALPISDLGAELGRDAEPGRARVHGGGAAAGAVAGAVPDDRRVLPEHVRRRGAGSARPAAQGRGRASGCLRHRP